MRRGRDRNETKRGFCRAYLFRVQRCDNRVGHGHLEQLLKLCQHLQEQSRENTLRDEAIGVRVAASKDRQNAQFQPLSTNSFAADQTTAFLVCLMRTREWREERRRGGERGEGFHAPQSRPPPLRSPATPRGANPHVLPLALPCSAYRPT